MAMTEHTNNEKTIIERPSRPQPIRATSASSLPSSATNSGGGGGGGGGPASAAARSGAVPGKRAQMMRSMRTLNRAAASGASSDPQQHQEQPRRSSTGDARKAFGGALVGQGRQRGKNIGNNGSNSMPNLYQDNAGTSISVKRGIRPASSRSNEITAQSLQSSAASSSRRDIIVQELHRSESGRHVVDCPGKNATDQHSMFEAATRRRAERAAARRRSQEGPAGLVDNKLQAQLAQAAGGGAGSESRRASMGSRISSMSSASGLSSPVVGGAESRRRSGDHIRRSMDLSHVAQTASGSGRTGSMSHNYRLQCSTRSLNTSASAMSAVSNASSTLISEQPVVEEEFGRLRLQMSSQQQSQSQAPPSASAAAAPSSTMDDDERLARELQEQYVRESRATHEGGHGLNMTELYDGTRVMVVNRNSIGHGSVGGGDASSGSGSDRRVLCAGCNGRFRVSSGCELLMCPKCDTLTPV